MDQIQSDSFSIFIFADFRFVFSAVRAEGLLFSYCGAFLDFWVTMKLFKI